MWSSWFFFVTDSILVFWIHGLPHYSGKSCLSIFLRCFGSLMFTAPVTRELMDLLHGIASAIYVSNFSRVLNDVFVFFVIRIDIINFSQILGIFEFWLFDCPFLLFFLLSGFPNPGPRFWPTMLWSSSCLNFCQSPPGPHFSFWRCLSFNRVNFVNHVHESDNLLSSSTFQ